MRIPGKRGHSRTHSQPPNGSKNVDDMDEVDDSNKNIILEIIKQMGTNADLSRITLPTFILERKSMLERITNLMQHPVDLIEAAQLTDPVDRFVKVVRWYMSGWYIAPKAVKKPLNPVLGEYYTCYWDLGKNGTAYYVGEQTSHHPPKSSYWYSIPEYGIHADGLLLPRSRFQATSFSAASLMDGIGTLYFKEYDETYTLTQPNIYARGILTGNLKFELGDKAVVECAKTGMRADIEFKVKGWVSGSYNEIEAKITHKHNHVHTLTGKWDSIIHITDSKHHNKEVFFDTQDDEPVPPQVRPLDEQGEFESGKLWKPTLDALGRRNHEEATDAKAKVENHQRKLAKDREASGEKFEPKLFAPDNSKLEYRFLHSDQIREHPERAHELIAGLVPILPGDKFPSGFEKPYDKKVGAAAASGAATSARAPAGAGTGAAAGGAAGAPNSDPNLDLSDDEFVDAPDSLPQ